MLACPVVDKFIGVLPGLGGNHADIIYCAGNENVYHFLQDVLDEVMALFPSRYIHLGGDEAWKTHWKQCPLCQKRIREEKLAVGKFNRDIAKEMKISERTVKNHISSIFKKLEVTDRTQAAVFAIRNNIIQIM